MPLTRETRRIVNEWLAGVLCVSLLLAPMGGCPQNGDNTGDGGDSSTGSGLFINQDSSGNVLMAARGQDGAEFFVFGSRGANGGLEEVDSILVRTASDEEAFVTFESGRPVHAQGPDGSYCHIEYSNVTSTSLGASIDVYDAGTKETTNYTTSIDLQQSLEDLAALVRERTGLTIQPISVVDDGTIQTGKTMAREAVRITIIPLYAIFVVPLVAVVYAMTVVLAQIVYYLAAVVTAAIELVLISIFSPIFLIAELLGDTVIHIRLTSLITIFGVLPDPPLVILF